MTATKPTYFWGTDNKLVVYDGEQPTQGFPTGRGAAAYSWSPNQQRYVANLSDGSKWCPAFPEMLPAEFRTALLILGVS